MSEAIAGTMRCLAVDVLKLKRTLAPVLTIVLPSLAAGLETLSVVSNGLTLVRGVDAAGWFCYEAFSIWCFVLLPLYVAVESSLIAGIEHQSHGWRRLLSLPTPRGSVYLSKLTFSRPTSARASPRPRGPTSRSPDPFPGLRHSESRRSRSARRFCSSRSTASSRSVGRATRST